MAEILLNDAHIRGPDYGSSAASSIMSQLLSRWLLTARFTAASRPN